MSQSAFMLNNMMKSVLDKGIRKESNALDDADIADIAAMISSPPTNEPRQIVATLFLIDTTHRHITTDIPRNAYTQHMVFSLMALIQAALNEFDEECIDFLNRSLLRMNRAYQSGACYSDIENLTAIPTAAYMAAIMGE